MRNKFNSNREIIIFTLVAVLVGVASRTVFNLGPNVEFVTALSLAAGYFFHKRSIAFFVPLIIMLISDSIIGNTNIYLFTWSGFLFTPILGFIISKFSKDNILKTLVIGTGAGLTSVLIFFLWTNLGVVILGNGYTKDIDGLIQSYINGLPFLKNQLVSNVIFVPLVIYFTSLIINLRSLVSIPRKDNLN